MSGLVKIKDANQHGSYRSNSSPDGIRSTNGQSFGNDVQQKHAYAEAYQKTNHPIGGCGTRTLLGFAQTRCKSNFKKAGYNKERPIHKKLRFTCVNMWVVEFWIFTLNGFVEVFNMLHIYLKIARGHKNIANTSNFIFII